GRHGASTMPAPAPSTPRTAGYAMHCTVVLAPDGGTLRSRFLRAGLYLRNKLFALFCLVKRQIVDICRLDPLYFHILEELFATKKRSIHSKRGKRFSFGANFDRVNGAGSSFKGKSKLTSVRRDGLFRHIGRRLGSHLGF